MSINNFDLNLLKVFVSVAEEGNFSRAAKKLFIEQPSVSRSIQRLESELSCPLFLRTKRKVQLTSKGSELLILAINLLQIGGDFLSLAKNKENEISGIIKFGAESPISSMLMPQAIAQISKSYPILWPMMFTGLNDDIIQRVKRRELEFAFLFYEGIRVKELEYREVGQCKYKVVASTKITKESLHSFIGFREVNEQNSPKLPTFEKIKRINKLITIKYSANDINAYKELILNGLGIGLLPAKMVESEIKKKKLKVMYPELNLQFPIFVAHHSSYPLSLEAISLIKSLRDQLEN